MAASRLIPRRMVAASGMAALLAGCGTVTLDRPKAERTIRSLVTQRLGLAVRSVRCPDNVELKKGSATICRVTLTSGETERFMITQTDDRGNGELAPIDMFAGQVEKTISARLKQGGIPATAVCPQHVAIRAGASFVCTASGPVGSSARIRATIVDRDGHFTLRPA